MKIIDKIALRNRNVNNGSAPTTIAFLGDSVTQGCFELYYDERANEVCTVFDRENAPASKLWQILQFFYPAAQINIINSGISGESAHHGLDRFDRDVAAHHPDLVVIGYALNDCGDGDAGKETYRRSLAALFDKTLALGAECIFLTPNLMHDYVSSKLDDERIKKLAKELSEKNMLESLDEYVQIAKQVATEKGVLICDVYSKWQKLKESGVDTTELLSNKINHPVREMNWMTAGMLAQMLFEM